jgi:hypothetical protein
MGREWDGEIFIFHVPQRGMKVWTKIGFENSRIQTLDFIELAEKVPLRETVGLISTPFP